VHKKCAICGMVYYCSKPCQVQDWKAHKRACKPPTAKLVKHKDKTNGVEYWSLYHGKDKTAGLGCADVIADLQGTGVDFQVWDQKTHKPYAQPFRIYRRIYNRVVQSPTWEVFLQGPRRADPTMMLILGAVPPPKSIKTAPTTSKQTNKQINKQNETKQTKTKQNKTKQDKTKRNKTKRNKTKQNKTKQNKTD
jgi:hypothetical protein